MGFPAPIGVSVNYCKRVHLIHDYRQINYALVIIIVVLLVLCSLFKPKMRKKVKAKKDSQLVLSTLTKQTYIGKIAYIAHKPNWIGYLIVNVCEYSTGEYIKDKMWINETVNPEILSYKKGDNITFNGTISITGQVNNISNISKDNNNVNNNITINNNKEKQLNFEYKINNNHKIQETSNVIVISDSHYLENDIRTNISEFPYATWNNFDRFNPIQSAILPYIVDDVNLVIATGTSTGKSVIAEMAISHQWYEKQKSGIYLGPMRSLTQEFVDRWTDPDHCFSSLDIEICTGDYKITERRIKELNKANALIMTPEMLAVRCRNIASEKSKFIQNAGIIVVDEAHLLTCPGRGDSVEVMLMGIADINPNVKFVLLSATMKNSREISEWISKLNGKKTILLESDYRPIVLQTHFPTYDDNGKYQDIENNKITEMIKIIKSFPEDKFLVFFHTKASGYTAMRRLESVGIHTVFFNADQSKEDRILFMQRFNDKEDLRVMLSSSSNAWGCNSHASHVIIVGVHRGLTEVENYDLKQMCLDLETEVLTKNGWKKYNEIEISDIVASFCLETGKIEYSEYTNKTVRSTTDDEYMVCFDGPYVNMRVTNEHNIVSRSPGVKSYCLRSAEEVIKRTSPFYIPVAATRCDIEDTTDITDAQLRFVGLFLSLEEDDGYLRSTNNTDWCKLERWFDQSIPDIYNTLSRRQFAIFIDGLDIGDGKYSNKNIIDWSSRITTICCGNNRRMADRIQQLAIERCYSCNCIQISNELQKPSDLNKNPKQQYIIMIRDIDHRTIGGQKESTNKLGIERKKLYKEPVDKKVWCLTTHYGTLVARRNGKVFITGNSGRAGRPGWSDKGIVHLLVPESESDKWIDRYNSGAAIDSTLSISRKRVYESNDEHAKRVSQQTGDVANTIAHHLIAQIYNGLDTKEKLEEWFKKTLAYFQNGDNSVKSLGAVIRLLLKDKLAEISSDGLLKVTHLGKIASILYYPPFDIASIDKNIKSINDKDNINDEDISYVLSNITSNASSYLSKRDKELMCPKVMSKSYRYQLLSEGVVKPFVAWYQILNGDTEGYLGQLQGQLMSDSERTIAAITMMNSFLRYGIDQDVLDIIGMRCKYGVRNELVQLVRLDNIGRVRANKLYNSGIKTYEDIINATHDEIRSSINKNINEEQICKWKEEAALLLSKSPYITEK